MSDSKPLNGKVLFISGGSRGIGKAIAVKAAQDGACIAIAAKTADPNPKLEGTIFTAAKAIEEAGGQALPLQVDVREEDQIKAALEQTADKFGGIDIIINNASAISLTPSEATSAKRFDLMHSINVRGTFLTSSLALPWLKKSNNPHILTLSPPLNMEPHWFSQHMAYTMSKYAMSMCTLGFAEEQKANGIAANSLWPRTTIATAAVTMLMGQEAAKNCRTDAIMADAAYAILCRPSRECTGNFFVDDDVLREEGVTDFEQYAVEPGQELWPDLFL